MANSNSRTKNAKLNYLYSLLLQVVTAISGLILPRMIIPAYGSSVNGLIATISQFISYMALLEAGVGSVFRASLYAPLYNNDKKRISGIINEQKRFYKKLGSIFIVYVLILCILVPMIVKTDYDYVYISFLVLILSVGTFLEYFVSLPYQSLIIADQMVRLVHILGSVVIIINIAVSYVLIKMGASILAVKAASAVVAIIKPIVYVVYTKKHYELNPDEKPDETALSQRWNGMVHHLAYYIHRNTDIILLSIFIGTKTVSIYSVYLAVVVGIEKIVTSISGSLNAGIGNVIASSDKRVIDKTVDCFEFIQTMATSVLFTITAIMLIPFIKLYTIEMVDANYLQPVFGYLLILAESIYCIRCIYSSISMNGNRFKETQVGAIMESCVNLILSFALIILLPTEELKLISVAAGTFAGMVTRLVYEVNYLRKDLIFRPAYKAVKTISVFALSSLVSVITCYILIDYSCDTIPIWVVKAILTTIIVSLIAILTSYLFLKNSLISVYKKIIRG